MDRETVIKQIALCINDEPCNECELKEYFFCKNLLLKNALALLKEQKAKTGHWIDTTKVIGFPRVQCSVCGSGQGAVWMDYCPICGTKMEGQ